MKNGEKIIYAAKTGFDSRLHTLEYKNVHSDDEQLNRLLSLFDIKPNRNYLDIGTGNGYVAFSLSEKFPDITVHGLDIATQSIEQNNVIAKEKGILNVSFKSYNGFVYPFSDNSFFGSVCRYAFHHFPNSEKSISEINRVLEPNGFFILSDPRTYEEDQDNFVDKFQQHLKDGHVHFYRRSEIEGLFHNFGLIIEKEFESTVRYPRIMNNTYEKLFKGTTKDILEKYKIEIEGNNVYITTSVMNTLFRKSEP